MPRSTSLLLLFAAAILSVGLGWQWLASEGVIAPERLQLWLSVPRAWRDTLWMPLAVIGVFCLSLLVLFPLTILVVLCGFLFGPIWGLGYAALGTLSSSVVTYWVGRQLGHGPLTAYGGRRARSASLYLEGKTIPAMTLVNLLPLAPFTLTNLLAGALRLRFRDYMIGSALGILPGLAVVSLIGSEIGTLLAATDIMDAALSLGILLALGLFLLLLRRQSRRRKASEVIGCRHGTERADERRSH